MLCWRFLFFFVSFGTKKGVCVGWFSSLSPPLYNKSPLAWKLQTIVWVESVWWAHFSQQGWEMHEMLKKISSLYIPRWGDTIKMRFLLLWHPSGRDDYITQRGEYRWGTKKTWQEVICLISFLSLTLVPLLESQNSFHLEYYVFSSLPQLFCGEIPTYKKNSLSSQPLCCTT